MTELSRHDEWLYLIDVSGPFLAEPVLKQVFPQGLEQTDPLTRKHVRQAYDEWRESVDTDDPDIAAIHGAWIDLVLKRVLELDEGGEEDVLKSATVLPESLAVFFPEHEVTLRPEYAVVDAQNGDQSLMFVAVYPPDTALAAPLKGDRWAASPSERMVELCRARDVRLGLVTNGERWMLVDAPVGGVTTNASWHARLWVQEPITLQAFVSLLGIRRFFVADSERLPALLDESLKLQDQVTDALGEQVRRAIEVLVQALDRADVDRNRELLVAVEPPELYEAALTVMMRIVFLLSAEERGLLLLDDATYQAYYAVSTLRMQLRAESEEILERRQDAWSRLLAVFRAVYGGIEHEMLKLSALGGSLFDPDRFPLLEGRAKGTSWKDCPASPLPIDNRTVLLLLDAVQLFEGRTLSYRALDIEQIGYVYEGLLERTVARAPEVTLDLDATKSANTPWVTLNELESAAAEGENALQALLGSRTGSSASRVKNDLAKKVDDTTVDRLLTACQGARELQGRIRPYLHLLRVDRWGYPLVYPEGTFMVTAGADRRETGTHYTPKSLTEAIVKETLEPVVYVGPAEGEPRQDWTLRPPRELLDLKICDPAMGSGAFLVQACRWLSERLVEAWRETEAAGQAITAKGEVVDDIGAFEPLRDDAGDRMLMARRVIAERCLYGVDKNPLAVELAKLSIWLITLAKGRPFGFLDHNLRCGDSLLGIHRLDQLTELKIQPGNRKQYRLFGKNIEQGVRDAIDLRYQLRETRIHDIRDVEAMSRLNEKARLRLELPEAIANRFIEDVLKYGTQPSELETSLSGLAAVAELALSGDADSITRLSQSFDKRCPRGKRAAGEVVSPFHWPLEFPEVFGTDKPGFDVVVSNPPWGSALLPEVKAAWKTMEGDKLERLVDSFHLFLIRSSQLLCGGRKSFAGLLLPDVLLYQRYSTSLRRFLITKCRIASVCNIGNGAFTGVTRPCCYVVFSTSPALELSISIKKWRSSKSSDEDVLFTLAPASLESFPGCIIPTNNLAEYSEVARWVSILPYKLCDLVDEYGIQRGASADNKEVFVLPAKTANLARLESTFLKPVVTGGVHLKPFQVSNELPLLIYTTRDTREYEMPNILHWVARHAAKITCKEVKQGKHPIYSLHRPREARLFERKVKVLGVITADRPKVAVDIEQRYVMDGVFLFAPCGDVDPYFLAGILNSSLMAKIYRVFSQEEGRVMAQVKPTIIADLPIVPSRSGDEAMDAMAARISNLSRMLHSAELDNDSRSAHLEEMDSLVDELFSCAARLVENSNTSSREKVGAQ